MTIYSEGGRGRKKCPNCNNYIGVRNRKCCHCDHEFASPSPKKVASSSLSLKTSSSKKIIVYSSPGPKRKKCPDCERFLRCNATECICGHQFTPKVKKTIVTRQNDRFVAPCKSELEASQFAQSFGGHELIVTTPSGECSVRLNATDYETVSEWCDRVVAVGQQCNRIYAPSALRYFVRDFFPYGTREYTMCCENIEEWAIQFAPSSY